LSRIRSTTRSPGAAGERRDAHVDQLAAERQPDAPVLRQPPLGNVKPRHHLDAAHHHRRDVRRQPQRLLQHAVLAHPHDQAGLVRLDVDVADALPCRIGDQAVDQANGRRVVGRVEQILRRQILGQMPQILADAEIAGIGGRRLAAHRVIVAEQPVERLGRHELHRERPRQPAPQLDQRGRVRPLAHRDLEVAVGGADQHHPVLAGKGIRDAHRHLRRFGRGVDGGLHHNVAFFEHDFLSPADLHLRRSR
jgi:hypothetical protein